jgi:hypothetical protein
MEGRIVWDETGNRKYETGTDRGVLYLYGSKAAPYANGTGWDGLTGMTLAPSGAEATDLWADNIKYLTMRSAEQLGLTISAYQSPKEFDECDGAASIAPGVTIGQQKRKMFGITYRSIIGNDTELDDHGYKIHLVYGITASPSQREYKTVNNSPEGITFSWTCTTTPVDVPGFKPTAHVEIDSTKVDPTKLKTLEDILYGTDAVEADPENGIEAHAATAPRLPLPAEVMKIFSSEVIGG